MIKLRKSDEPTVLQANAARWLQELEDAIAIDDKKLIKSRKNRYNHPEIKAAVKLETHGKCAFCECDVTAVSHGDIEHLFPKSLEIKKTFEWSNLGYSCQICNQSKSDRDPNFERIIDPYISDPEQFIFFYGAFINSNGTVEGRQTIHHLKLDRVEVFERRQNVIRSLIKSIEMIQSATTSIERQILIEDFESNELGPELEFSAMRRDFWRAYRPNIIE
ncbi:hypothetical protein K6W37_09400 [Acetobacter senegalensis]|uniref:hypothetical protein n=1 Tax=Acetobacter senegalensis TaxID=446692 RepID=UPI001ED9F911|nr:hypothetical protein [Acetobacter senegalensis]MCG4254104.1 hypothetical protein [Acetobacter senegalensis]